MNIKYGSNVSEINASEWILRGKNKKRIKLYV